MPLARASTATGALQLFALAALLFLVPLVLGPFTAGMGAANEPAPVDPVAVHLTPRHPSAALVVVQSAGQPPRGLHFEGPNWDVFRVDSTRATADGQSTTVDVSVSLTPLATATGFQHASAKLVFDTMHGKQRVPMTFADTSPPRYVVGLPLVIGVGAVLWRRRRAHFGSVRSLVGALRIALLLVGAYLIPVGDALCPDLVQTSLGPATLAQCRDGRGGLALASVPTPGASVLAWLALAVVTLLATSAFERDSDDATHHQPPGFNLHHRLAPNQVCTHWCNIGIALGLSVLATLDVLPSALRDVGLVTALLLGAIGLSRLGTTTATWLGWLLLLAHTLLMVRYTSTLVVGVFACCIVSNIAARLHLKSLSRSKWCTTVAWLYVPTAAALGMVTIPEHGAKALCAALVLFTGATVLWWSTPRLVPRNVQRSDLRRA